MSKISKVMVVGGMAVAAIGMTAMSASADGYKIGFAQSYNGNSYRQTQEAQMEIVANELKEAGKIAEYTVAEANQDVARTIPSCE